MRSPSAAIVTIGSELVEGLRLDTNTAEIARALGPRGVRVREALSVGDDKDVLAAHLRRLGAAYDLVITTGGLGPTHDDVTRDAASLAFGLPLVEDPRLVKVLGPAVRRHRDPRAAEQVLVQARVLEGAEVIDATTGTAPGLVVRADRGVVALLPGPPSEMRPMLHALLERYPLVRAEPHELGVAGMTESDAQVTAQSALEPYAGVGFTVLARPGDVHILLLDDGAGAHGLSEAAGAVSRALGERVYSDDGAPLQAVVIREAAARGVELAVAESCTGGMISAALTEVPGASEVLKGGVVAYSNSVKTSLLGVSPETLATHGAVSAQTAEEMAVGARSRLAAHIAVSVTGIAGPDGGSDDKPVGLVWFGISSARGTRSVSRHYPATS
jgi:nicotinamide-nucleotide amidase